MYPTFDIYLSILYGTWQPWLSPNRKAGLFDRLLQSLMPETENTCSGFFSGLVSLMGRPRLPQEKEFLKEAIRLADITGCRGGNGLLELPAFSAREHFYNLLIGYSLQGYEKWTARLLRDHQDKETGNWYHSRLTDRLKALLRLQHLPESVTPEEQLLICRVKAALCILLHRLTTGRTVKTTGFRGGLTPRGELLGALSRTSLPSPQAENIMELFDISTNQGKPPPAASSPGVPATAETSLTDTDLLSIDEQVVRIIKSIEGNLEIFHLIKDFFTDDSQQPRKPSADNTIRLLDSKSVREKLRISKSSLQRLHKKGLRPYTKIGGKLLYREEDVNKLIEEGKSRKKKGKPGNGPLSDNS